MKASFCANKSKMCLAFTSVQWKASMRDRCQELIYCGLATVCVWCMVIIGDIYGIYTCSFVYIIVMYSLVSVMYGHYRRHFHLPIDVSPNIHWRSVWPELPLLVPHRNLYMEQIRKNEYKMKIMKIIRLSGWLLVFFPNTCFSAHVWLGVIHMTGFADLLESIVSGHLHG